MTIDYCSKILGASQYATKDEIKKAFRKKAFKYHPDNNGNAEMFIKLQKCEQFLLDHHANMNESDNNSNTSNKRNKTYGADKENKTARNNPYKTELRMIIRAQISDIISKLNVCSLKGLTVYTLDGQEVGKILDEKINKDKPSLSLRKVKIDYQNGDRKSWKRFDFIVQEYVVGFTDSYNQELAKRLKKLRIELLTTYGIQL